MKCFSLQLLALLVTAGFILGCSQVTTPTPDGGDSAGARATTEAAAAVAMAESVGDSRSSGATSPAASTEGAGPEENAATIGGANVSDVRSDATPTGPAANHSSDAAELAPPTAAAGTAAALVVAVADSLRPMSAVEIRKVIDLRKLPRLAETGRYSDGPTNMYYGARASVRAADAFYRAELEGQSWSHVPGIAKESPEYADRLYARDGLWLHVSIGAGGDQGTVGVNLTVLGNMDLTQLPRAGNAQFQEGSSPVNVSYRSPASIVELARFCQEQLTSLGWIPWTSSDGGPAEPPHVKTLTFLQEAACLRVLIHRDPVNPAEPGLVAIFSEPTLPFDLPLSAGVTGLKLDVHTGKAEYLLPLPLSEVPQFVSEAAARYGWETDPAGMQQTGDALATSIQDGPETGFTLRVSSQEGHALFEYQRLTLKDPQVASRDSADGPTESDSAAEEREPGDVTGDSPTSAAGEDADEQDDEIDREVAGALRDARQTIAGELGKLRAQLGGLPGSEALTDELEKQFLDDGGESESDAAETPGNDDAPSTSAAESSDGDSDQNAFLVPAKEGGPKDVVNAKVLYDGKTLEMKHILLFQARKHGELATVVYLSDRPLKLSALKSRRIGDLSLFDLSEDFDAQSMELRINSDYTSINCHLQGGSISLSSGDVKSEVKLAGDRISGLVYMEKPEDFFDKPFRIDVQFDARPATVAQRAAAAGSSELTMDESDGLPVPADNAGTSRQSSAFRSNLTTNHSAPVGKITDLYRSALPELGWQELPQTGLPAEDGARMMFRGEKGDLAVRLTAEGAGTRIELVLRDEAAARKAGLLPPAGRVRVVFGNANDAEVVIELDGKPVKLAAHEGETDPATARKIDTAPGLHKLVIKVTGSSPQKEEFTAAEGSTWGVIAVPGGGCFVDQVY